MVSDRFTSAGGGKLSFSLLPQQPLPALAAAAIAAAGTEALSLSAVVVMDDHVYDAFDHTGR
jgi:hypothetical protein